MTSRGFRATATWMHECAALLLAGCIAASCGGSAPPLQEPEEEPETAFRRGGDDESDVGIASEVGAMNEAKVRRTFKRARKGLEACLTDGRTRVEFMGGAVAFFVAVNLDGTVKDAYLEQSTLGNRETEKCLTDVLRSQDWPRPVGGKVGKARSSMNLDPHPDVRPPIDWTAEEIEEGLQQLTEDLNTCKEGNGPFSVTIYVGTDGSVMSAGGAPPDAAAEPAVDCIVGVLMSAQFASPGSWPAKVSFQL